MKVLYKIKFVLLLILVSQFANAQVDWTFFSDYLVEPGSKSSASFLSGIALSDGNVIGTGILYDDEPNEGFVTLTLLSSDGQFIKEHKTDFRSSGLPLYVRDIPQIKTFFMVSWDHYLSYWIVTHWSYSLEQKSSESIKYAEYFDAEFPKFGYLDKQNGDIVIYITNEVVIEEIKKNTFITVLDGNGNFISKKVVKDNAVVSLVERLDQSGYFSIGRDLIEFDNDFNVIGVNINDQIYSNNTDIRAINFQDKILVNYVDRSEKTHKWNLGIFDNDFRILTTINLGEAQNVIGFHINSLDIDPDGNIYVGVNFFSDRKVKIAKLDSNFNIAWIKEIFDDQHYFSGDNLRVNFKGDLIVCGQSNYLETTQYTEYGFISKVTNESISNTKDGNLSVNSVTLLPNPAINKIWFNATEDLTGTPIDVLDITGRLITSYTISSDYSIDISNLNQGLYFVKFADGNMNLVSKAFIKE